MFVDHHVPNSSVAIIKSIFRHIGRNDDFRHHFYKVLRVLKNKIIFGLRIYKVYEFLISLFLETNFLGCILRPVFKTLKKSIERIAFKLGINLA